jgi:hypothetical protein
MQVLFFGLAILALLHAIPIVPDPMHNFLFTEQAKKKSLSKSSGYDYI